MTRFQMKRRFPTPRVFEGPNLLEKAIKGYIIKKYEKKHADKIIYKYYYYIFHDIIIYNINNLFSCRQNIAGTDKNDF